MAPRIVVVDDHKLIRESISRLLTEQGFEVVGQAGDGFEALDKAREMKPDAVLMDLSMPGLDGISATRLIRRELPNVNVVMLTMSEEEDDIIEAVQAGARGYITKSADSTILARQLKQVLSGGVGMSEDMTERLVKGLSRTVRTLQAKQAGAALTDREKEVLALIGKGATNKSLAASLIISQNTVRAHVRSLMQKLNAENRTQLAVYALREGLVPGKGGRKDSA